LTSLLQLGAKVRAFDPEAMENVKAIYGDRITYCKTMYDTLEGADSLAIMTEWVNSAHLILNGWVPCSARNHLMAGTCTIWTQ
jgi:UDP-glucose 6-dehydrogenase